MMDEVCRENRSTFAVLVILWVVAIVAIIILPDTIPAHWGFDSTEPNRWGSKLELLILPVSSTIICVGCMGATRVMNVRGRQVERTVHAYVHDRTQCLLPPSGIGDSDSGLHQSVNRSEP